MTNLSTEPKVQKTGSAKLIDSFTEWSMRWIPDSMVFVLSLTAIVYLMALGLTKHGPLELVDDYAKGFWLLLTFAMQMSIMMITGFVIADAKPVKRAIIALIDWPKTARSTIVMFSLVCGAIAWLHWGVGLMMAMIMGREIAVRKRGLGIHYPFIAGASYGTLVIMANGPSQAAPLLVATPGNFLEKMMGIIPLTETSFSPFMISFLLIELVTLPLILLLIMPKKEDAIEIDDARYKEFTYVAPDESGDKILRPAERWERSRLLQSIVALGILLWVGKFLYYNGVGKLDLNVMNFAFFGLGLILHGSPHSFIDSVKKGVNTTYGVIIQFPMYAGIFGLISNSGLAAVITHWFISISTPGTYPWIVFVYTGVMDFFVPSAGSKFVIEAPYIIPAAKQLGVPVQQIINAYGSGAQWVNTIQPFWALPFLAAYKLRFQDILPFTFIIFIFSGIVGSLYFLLFPMGF